MRDKKEESFLEERKEDTMAVYRIVAAILIARILIGGGVMGYNMVELCDRTESSAIGDVFVFGGSYADWGNWMNYFSGKGYALDANRMIQPPTTWYTAEDYSVNIINSNGRASDGKNWVDFVANYYNLQKYRSSTIGAFPPGTGYMVNFAIVGSTFNGNVYNRMYMPGDVVNINQIAGSHGYDFQVNSFLSLLRNSQLKSITTQDLFIYDFVGGADMPYLYNCLDQIGCITNFTNTHLNNLKKLYDAGMRNVLFIHIDTLFHMVPSYIKFDTATTLTTGSLMDQLSSSIFNSDMFFANLTAFRTQYMPLLNLQRISYQDILGYVLYNFNQFGIRNSLGDDADPRYIAYNGFVNPNIPFPTQYDYFKQTGSYVKNVFFNDDNQLTEFSSRIMARAVIKYLEGIFKNCN